MQEERKVLGDEREKTRKGGREVERWKEERERRKERKRGREGGRTRKGRKEPSNLILCMTERREWSLLRLN